MYNVDDSLNNYDVFYGGIFKTITDYKLLNIQKDIKNNMTALVSSLKWVGIGQLVKIATQLVSLF